MTNPRTVNPLTIVLAVALAAALALLGFVALRSEPTAVAVTPQNKTEATATPKAKPKATPTPQPKATTKPKPKPTVEPQDEYVYDDEDDDLDLEYNDGPVIDNYDLTWDESQYVTTIQDYFGEDVDADGELMLVDLGYMLCSDLEAGIPVEDIITEGMNAGGFTHDGAAYIVMYAGDYLCPAYADAADIGA